MGYLGRRIGKSQTTANPQADGNTGGILDLFSGGYFQRTGNMPNAPGLPPTGLTATGGVISDYTSGPAVYRAHIFTSTGTFTVSALSTNPALPDSVEYLVVAGGGAGGGVAPFSITDGGGGGAGGYRTSMPEGPGGPSPTAESQITISGPFPSPYTITIGAGGAGGILSGFGGNGSPSSFGPTTSQGGGGGGGSVLPYGGVNGGSGGGTGDTGSGGVAGVGFVGCCCCCWWCCCCCCWCWCWCWCCF
jgi:hypothetical protein